jgi:hypothetical protein
MNISKFLICMAAALLASAGSAQAQEHNHAMTAPPSACAEVSLACADKVTPFFAGDGSLWVAWSAAGRVAVQRSTDQGRTFAAPMFVNHHPEKLDAGADSRPQIVVDGAGNIVVAYTLAVGADFTGKVLIARSRVGRTDFDAPKPLTSGDPSQRFIAVALDPGGDVFATWIDKRNLVAAAIAGKKYPGAALAFAWASGEGNFAVTRIAQDNTCECCRIGVAFAGPRKPVVMWRHLYPGGVRDHAVMTFADSKPGTVQRVSVDDWKIEACPHHGPSLAVSAGGTYHATWFTDGRARQGVFYARSTDAGQTFSAPMAVGDPTRQPSRPYVLAIGGTIWMVWKEFGGEESVVNVMSSRDDGMTWSKPKALARTADASDHPLLIAKGADVHLSWTTRQEGYRLMEIAP